MKRLITFIFIIGALVFNLQAQTDSLLFSDDFESFSEGDYVALNGDQDWWTTWSNEPGGAEDAVISSAQNHTANGTYSAHTQGNTTDLVLKLGNLTTGIFKVEFYYFVPAGKGAYFNIQHTETMGEEWAFECYFGNDGNGVLAADGQQVNFTHSNDQWIKVTFKADLFQDSAYLWIDDNMIFQWVFSHQSDGSDGLKQLGAVDFYAGALSGQTPEWYLDDVSYYLLAQPLDPPELTLSDSVIVTNGSPFLLTLQNDGEEDLEYDMYIRYKVNQKQAVYQNNPLINDSKAKKVVNLGQISEVKEVNDIQGYNASKDVVTLTHMVSMSADSLAGLGFVSQVDLSIAALFTNQEVYDYIGMKVDTLIIGVNDAPVANSSSAQIYMERKYTVPGPLTTVFDQAFEPTAGAFNVLPIPDDIRITGDDLWIGWSFTDPGQDVYPILTDVGPLAENANWWKYTPAWQPQDNEDFGNFALLAILSGDTVYRWAKVNVSFTGVIEPGASVNVPVVFDVSQPDQMIDAELVIRTNDPDDNEDFVVIPITYDPNAGEVDDNQNIVITKAYPNPTSDFLYLSSNSKISKVNVYSLEGKLINSFNPNANVYRIDVRDYQKGLYLVEIVTGNKTEVAKFMVE